MNPNWLEIILSPIFMCILVTIIFNIDQIRRLRMSCSNLYPTCESIAWTDPWECAWCVMQNMTGKSIIRQGTCHDGVLLMSCPPKVDKVEKPWGRLVDYTTNPFHNIIVDLLKALTFGTILLVSILHVAQNNSESSEFYIIK